MREHSHVREVFVTDLTSKQTQVPSWGSANLVELIQTTAGERLRPGNGTDFSVIIPTRSSTPRLEALKSLLGCTMPEGTSMECILAVGGNPSVQRNMAISIAESRLVGFLDDDCTVPQDWLNRSSGVMSSHSADILGGPNLTPNGSSFFAECVGKVLSSRLGTAMMRARYKPIGQDPRESSDHETALCNMVFMRKVFEKLRFNEEMFPNEENELLNRAINDGYKAVYDPGLTVAHPRKEGLRGFVRQALGYGLGRASQTRIQPRSLKPIHLLPSLGLAGLIIFVISLVTGPSWLAGLLGACLLAYVALAIVSGSLIAVSVRKALALPVSVLLYPTLHLSYGLGFVLGLILPAGKLNGGRERRVWLLRLKVCSHAMPALHYA